MSSPNSAIGGAKQESTTATGQTVLDGNSFWKYDLAAILVVGVVACLVVIAILNWPTQKQDPNQSSAGVLPKQQLQPVGNETPEDEARPPAAAFVPGQILIQFRSTATAEQRNTLRQKIGAQLRERLSTGQVAAAGFGEREGGLELLSFESKITAQGNASAALQEMARLVETAQSDSSVEFAEPNYIYSSFETSNDPYYKDGRLWGMYSPLGAGNQPPSVLRKGAKPEAQPVTADKKFVPVEAKPARAAQAVSQATSTSKLSRPIVHPEGQYGIRADTAWAAGHIGSRKVYVGIIDSGIQVDHPDLRENTSKIYAKNFYDDSGMTLAPNDSPHGTHVAGTIGAIGGNGRGVAGVVWQVTMIPVRFIGPDDKGDLTDALKAVQYLISIKNKGINIVAINASWGGTGYSKALSQAIKRAAKAGILFIAAAGNAPEGRKGTNNDKYPFYPAGYDTTDNRDGMPRLSFNSVLSVAAINRDGVLADFSNFGRKSVHLAAPGVDIWSTLPRASYGPMTGTSMATPHVTGAVALFKASHPGSTPEEIIGAIRRSITDTTSLHGRVLWGGRLNVSTF